MNKIEKKEKTFAFKNIGDADNMAYRTADIVKVCSMNERIAISFYQVDYQSAANILANTSDREAPNLINVAKVVMSVRDAEKLLSELKAVMIDGSEGK